MVKKISKEEEAQLESLNQLQSLFQSLLKISGFNLLTLDSADSYVDDDKKYSLIFIRDNVSKEQNDKNTKQIKKFFETFLSSISKDKEVKLGRIELNFDKIRKHRFELKIPQTTAAKLLHVAYDQELISSSFEEAIKQVNNRMLQKPLDDILPKAFEDKSIMQYAITHYDPKQDKYTANFYSKAEDSDRAKNVLDKLIEKILKDKISPELKTAYIRANVGEAKKGATMVPVKLEISEKGAEEIRCMEVDRLKVLFEESIKEMEKETKIFKIRG